MTDEIATINEWMWGYRTSRVLEVANKIQLFTTLADRPLSLGDICERCDTKPDMTEKLLIACAAMGLIEKRDALYNNSTLADTYLVAGRPLYQGDIIAHCDHVRHFWDQLEEEICTQPRIEDEAANHRNFIMGMHDMTMGPRGSIFSNNIDLSGKMNLVL